MKKLMSFKIATNLSLLLFGLFILFHLSIIIGIVFFDYVPVDFLWGGRMETKAQLLSFEIVSLLIMAFCIFIVLIKSKRINTPRLLKSANISLWILLVLFTLNTVENFFAKTTFENFFAIITAILAILCFRLAIEKHK